MGLVGEVITYWDILKRKRQKQSKGYNLPCLRKICREIYEKYCSSFFAIVVARLKFVQIKKKMIGNRINEMKYNSFANSSGHQ